MLLTKILFIVLILVCAAFYILYIWDFALVLLAVMAALPIIMFVCLLIAKNSISVGFQLRENYTSKNVTFPVQLSVTNKSIFPIGKAEARIEYCNVFTNEVSSFEIHLPIQPRNTQKLTFQLSSQYCGVIKVKCAKLYIFDPLKIFRMKLKSNIAAEIAIMPEGHEITGEVTATNRINEESSLFSQFKPGDDPSEVFDLRDYNPGDKLNRIHWKLSSKKDDFIVKDYSLPIDVPLVVFLDLKRYGASDNMLAIFDTLLESLLSISRFLIENERLHTVVYFNSDSKSFESVSVSSFEELSVLIRRIILSVSNTTNYSTPDVYFAENPDLALSSFTLITSSLTESVSAYIESELDADIKNAVVAAGPSDEIANLSVNDPAFSLIPVIIGRISSSIKDIEL